MSHPSRAFAALVAATLALAATAAAAAPPSLPDDADGPVDRHFVQKGDALGDGTQQTLMVHVTAASMRSPFKWTFSIADADGNSVYSVTRDDTAIDARFKDPQYVGQCADYLACKRKYYFETLPREAFGVVTASPAALPNRDRIFTVMPDVVGRFLKDKGHSDADIAATVAWMRATLDKPGFHELDVPDSPAKSAPPSLWVPALGLFVPFYEQ